MATKNNVQESYIAFTYVAGFRMYLSIMGGFNRGSYNYMWDREVRNSRDFETRGDALQHCKAAIEQNRQAQGVHVAKKLIHPNGMIELK